MAVLLSASEEYKSAIKSSEREIKCYVDMFFNDEILDGTVDNSGIPLNKAEICDADDFIGGPKVPQNYASLEESYFKLDGSFVLPNDPALTTNTNTGLISEDIVSNTTDTTITINNPTTTTLEQLTVYFKDNIPSDSTLTVNYSVSSTQTFTVTDNVNNQITFDFDEISEVTSFKFEFDNFEFNDRRIRIGRIEYGVGGLYSDQELINFDFTEEIDKFCLETPSSNLSITLGNYDDKFNPINPNGIVKFLNNQVKAIPYVGVVTEENGIEYESLGLFYLDNWQNNSDKTTTLNCLNLLNFINTEDIIDDDGEIIGKFLSVSEFETYLNDNYDYTFDVNTSIDSGGYGNNILFGGISDKSLLNLLQNFTIYSLGTMRVNKSNQIEINPLPTEISDTINFEEMKEKPNYENTDRIKTIKISNQEFGFVPLEYGQNILTDTIDLTGDTIHKIYFFNDILFQSYNTSNAVDIVCTGGTATFVSIGNYAICIDIDGTAGDTALLYLNNPSSEFYTAGVKNDRLYPIDEYTTDVGNKVMEINNDLIVEHYPLSYVPASIQKGKIKDHIFDNDTSYKITFNYFGNPTHEAGQMVDIETDFGYREMFITKLELKYNGGLSGYMEGVGN